MLSSSLFLCIVNQLHMTNPAPDGSLASKLDSGVTKPLQGLENSLGGQVVTLYLYGMPVFIFVWRCHHNTRKDGLSGQRFLVPEPAVHDRFAIFLQPDTRRDLGSGGDQKIKNVIMHHAEAVVEYSLP